MRCFQHWSVVVAWCSAAVAPPPVVVGGEGVDQAGNDGQSKLSDGIAASVVSGKDAINPVELPPMDLCGWEGADAGTVSLLRSHKAMYPGLSWSSSRIRPNPSAKWIQEL